jgi:hypothetical protein
MMAEFFDLEQWRQWLAGLDRTFVFLLALPFVVALVGLWSWWTEAERDEEAAEAAAPAPRAERRVRARRRTDASHVPQHGLR